MHNLTSFAGIFIIIAFCWAISANRRMVRWKTVASGIALQIVFALLVFVVPGGSSVFLFLNDLVVKMLDGASAGSRFVFGRLALPPGAVDASGQESMGFFLAFQALPTIIFFSSLMALLYYIGLLPRLIKLFSRVFTRFMGISGAESLCAASNVFVGVESATTVRPYIERMTRSELCTMLSVGMGTIASSVMGFYVFILQGQFPTIAGHLISASVLSAPAAIVVSKMLVPEDGRPVTLGMDVEPEYDRDSTAIESVIKGANDGLKLVFGIVALLIALIGLVTLADSLLVWIGGSLGMGDKLSLESVLGYVAYPFTLAIGVPQPDAMEVARLIGGRMVVTEVKAYQDLAVLMSEGRLTEPRSAVIATYALCGFAHVASMAIFVGGISAIVPSRMRDVSGLGVRALIAATLACLMTAAVAGTFYSKTSVIFGG